MSTPLLRGYQYQLISDIDTAIATGKRRIIAVAPTGSGKTVVMGAYIKQQTAAYKSVIALAHRREIVQQTSDTLTGFDIPHGIIQAGFAPTPMAGVQVCSVQTLFARGIRREVMDMPRARVLIIDEAHHCPASTYQRIIDEYPDAILLGFTATPARGDGRGLGSIFEVIVEGPQVADLIQLNYLVGTRCYAPVKPNLVGIQTVAGDYNQNQLEVRMDTPKLVGDVISNWHKLGENRQTIVFATGVGHSIHLRDEFIKSGVSCEHVDGGTPKDERDATLRRLASGEIRIVTNCQVLIEGWDCPSVSCCVLARPTKKMGLYRQMAGRVLRPYPDKRDAIIIDHSGAVRRHGFVEDPVAWTLEPDKLAGTVVQPSGADAFSDRKILECSECSALRTAGKACPACGFLPQRPPRSVSFVDGELGEVGRDRRVNPSAFDPELRNRWHAMLVHICSERGYQQGWAAHKFKEKFGAWPSWGARPQPIEPTPEVRSWVRSRQIAFAKARGVA